MAAKTDANTQYRSLSPLERDICRLLAEHELTGWAKIRRWLERERDSTVDAVCLRRSLTHLSASGLVEARPDREGIERRYILTEAGRRELQRRWCREGRDIRGGARDGV